MDLFIKLMSQKPETLWDQYLLTLSGGLFIMQLSVYGEI